ncbi:hypothetical protein [Oceanobacillus halotolerans]|uniref:hypothetical protein n=1 Tax=Oceanobacillus halotolerans TaxID=2663380 RepID=UPI0013DB36A9|nr:hypothetical protein [Oceanobacillus halotolerans]
MVRSFIVILLLAVFFLSGMVFGMGQENQYAEENQEEIIPPYEQESQAISDEQQLVEQPTKEDVTNTVGAIEVEEPTHFTQKMATFLETAVKGFYEAIVQIMYQVSQLFF